MLQKDDEYATKLRLYIEGFYHGKEGNYEKNLKQAIITLVNFYNFKATGVLRP